MASFDPFSTSDNTGRNYQANFCSLCQRCGGGGTKTRQAKKKKTATKLPQTTTKTQQVQSL